MDCPICHTECPDDIEITCTCCVCGRDYHGDCDRHGRIVATDHGPDYVCGECEYEGD